MSAVPQQTQTIAKEVPQVTKTFSKIISDAYSTKLTPEEEIKFQDWVQQKKAEGIIHPLDEGYDYDMRGAYKAGTMPQNPGDHWVDTYKKPNHETFSNESIYATGDNAQYAGSWTGPNHDQYVAPEKSYKQAQKEKQSTNSKQSLLTGGN